MIVVTEIRPGVLQVLIRASAYGQAGAHWREVLDGSNHKGYGKKIKGGSALLIGGGAVVGFLSGLAGSAGPLGAAIFLSLGLPPVACIASEATTALAMHGVKTAIYQHYISLNREFWFLAALMGVAMILGTWSAKRVIERMSQETFQRFVAILLIAIAGYMMVHG